jgi:hypothetical protein
MLFSLVFLSFALEIVVTAAVTRTMSIAKWSSQIRGTTHKIKTSLPLLSMGTRQINARLTRDGRI